MKFEKNNYALSATDLSNNIACAHLTQLERKRAHGELKKPHRKNQFLDRIIERGIEHEAAYIEYLKAEGSKSVVEIEMHDPQAQEKTINAMQAGIDVIAQGKVEKDRWGGRPDFLIRVETASPILGEWSYEVADTKLTQTTKAGTILQLCVYSELVSDIQGVKPENMYVVMPSDSPTQPFQSESHRFDDYAAYYRLAKHQFTQTLAVEVDDTSYPEPVSHCDICQWWPDCDKRRRDDDHLTYVAGISTSQIKEFKLHNINTLTKLATSESTDISKIDIGSEAATDRVYQQAKIQHAGKTSGKPQFEFLEVTLPEDGNSQLRGLLRLPEPDPAGDLFFDIESARHAPGGGLEYLLGFAHGQTQNNNAEPLFDYFWGLDSQSEKKAFEDFIDLAMQRLKQSPGMHIYHFAPYEPVALKRLATRHATREAELDTLLRRQCFVDLYAVTRQSIRASVESYSIKCLEQFYGYEREEELAEARLSMHRLEEMLEIGASSQVHDDDKKVVLKYNRDDCVSTIALRNWLETLRTQQINNGIDLPRPPVPEEYTSTQEDRAQEVQKVFEDLTDDFSSTPQADWNEEQSARWLLANSLDYFRREEKNAYWEYYRLRELDTSEMLKERNAMTGLSFVSEIPPQGRGKIPSHVYTYLPQFVTFDEGAELYEASSEDGAPGEFKIGTVVSIDHAAQTVEIKKTGKTIETHPASVFHHRMINPKPMPDTLLDFGRTVAANKTRTIETAQYDLLSKRPPRFSKNIKIEDVIKQSGVSPETTFELVSNLNRSVLAIQGPPGTGKTYTGSHVIAKLLKAGKSVGITAVSHAVIANLLSEVQSADPQAAIAHKGDKTQVTNEACERLNNKDDVLTAIDNGRAVGATAFTWAAPELDQQLDYLFIDEAGQMSLAMALTAARSARNIVLLGDPQQLEQPQRASHPEGSEVAALAHLIGDRQTISPNQGVFLNKTYRMHPSICKFTSEQYYDDRLTALSELKHQIIAGENNNAGKQLVYVPVEHTGNQSRSEDEAKEISKLTTSLLDGSHHWIDKDQSSLPLNPSDILVVAPYNAQVALLRSKLAEDIRVGTVDKFQGQQAPVVIYSMTSSSVEEAPRGMSFLFSPNRFNVATSRAKCTVFVFGSPTLVNADCKTPEQIYWVNGLCRYLELAVR